MLQLLYHKDVSVYRKSCGNMEIMLFFNPWLFQVSLCRGRGQLKGNGGDTRKSQVCTKSGQKLHAKPSEQTPPSFAEMRVASCCYITRCKGANKLAYLPNYSCRI